MRQRSGGGEGRQVIAGRHGRGRDEGPVADPPADVAISYRRVFVMVLVAGAAIAALLGLWVVREILLLVFGAVLVAEILRTAADQVERVVPIGPKLSLPIVLVAIVAALAAVGLLFGRQMAGELSGMASTLPDALDAVRERLGIQVSLDQIADRVEEMLQRESETVLGRMSAVLYAAIAVVVNLLLVVAGGIYFAAQPHVYRRGLLHLLAPAGRRRAGEVLDLIWANLRQWLVGQLLSMGLVAMLTMTALWLLGVPSAVALGLLAGIAEFVPIVGPIVAATPAVLIAAGVDWTLALWTAGAFFVIQQVESNVALPLIQRRMVAIPPAVTVFSILAFGVLLGPLGVVVAAPLTVAAFVIVRELYPEPKGGGTSGSAPR